MGDDYTIADIATFPWINNLIGFYGAGELVGIADFANVRARPRRLPRAAGGRSRPQHPGAAEAGLMRRAPAPPRAAAAARPRLSATASRPRRAEHAGRPSSARSRSRPAASHSPSTASRSLPVAGTGRAARRRARHPPRRIDAGERAGGVGDAAEQAALDQMRIGERVAGARRRPSRERRPASSAATQSATLRSRVQRSTTSIIAAQLALRLRQRREAGSSLSSGRPVTSHKRGEVARGDRHDQHVAVGGAQQGRRSGAASPPGTAPPAVRRRGG